MSGNLGYNLASWSVFFSAVVRASAALTGLLFVSISINLSKMIAFTQLTTRAAKGLIALATVLIAPTICLVPGLTQRRRVG